MQDNFLVFSLLIFYECDRSLFNIQVYLPNATLSDFFSKFEEK